MTSCHRIAAALMCLSLAVPFVPTPARAARAYVVESDFSTGSFSSVNVATRSPNCDVASVHSDARVH